MSFLSKYQLLFTYCAVFILLNSTETAIDISTIYIVSKFYYQLLRTSLFIDISTYSAYVSSSMYRSNTFAILYANSKDGLYRPFSMDMIVCLDTPIVRTTVPVLVL